MGHIVQIKPANFSLWVNDDETVLDAALRQDIDFPYSCMSAICSTCQGRVLEGKIEYGEVEPYGLEEEELAAGAALFCSAKPVTNLLIELEDFDSPLPTSNQEYHYQLAESHCLARNIYEFILTPEDKELNFVPGQYLLLKIANKSYPFSIANAPRTDKQIQLQIRINPEDEFFQQLLQLAEKQGQVTLQGPSGHCVCVEGCDFPVILIAGSTGFAQCKALLEHLLENKHSSAIHFYWGVNDVAELYHDQLLKNWEKEYKNFHYTPVIASEGNFPHHYLEKEFSSLANHLLYCSGPQAMVDSVKKTSLDLCLSPHLFFSDFNN